MQIYKIGVKHFGSVIVDLNICLRGGVLFPSLCRILDDSSLTGSNASVPRPLEFVFSLILISAFARL